MAGLNAFTIDVEEHFQVQAFAGVIPREAWSQYPSRVEANTRRLLELLARHPTRATFFCLGWVGERHPGLIRDIVAAGHELASHGMAHELVHVLGPVRFREEAASSRKLLEDLTGAPVLGYRAATFSMDARTPWAHAILAEAGYRYSSSINPIRHDLYGMPEAPLGPFRPHPDGVVEIPVAALAWGARRIPCGGGGYFRLYPQALSRWLLRAVNQQGRAAVFYCHPWELDPEQPRVADAPRLSRFRHYLNLTRTEARLHDLLEAFPWDTMSRVFAPCWEGGADNPCQSG